MTCSTWSPIPASSRWRGIECGATEGHGRRASTEWHPAPSSSAKRRSSPSCEMISRLGGSPPCPCGRSSSPRREASFVGLASPPHVTEPCKQPSSWCSSRSSRRTSSRARTASAPDAEPRTPSRRSSSTPPTPTSGCWRAISNRASTRSTTRHSWAGCATGSGTSAC
jgi:hypothetical protein